MSDNRILGPTTDPSLADLMFKIRNDVFYSLNCIQIGTIEGYDNVKNTAKISINFKRKMPDGTENEYPLLVDCPVVIMSGGDSCISLPISTGDTCIILFNDRNIDNWFWSGEISVPDTPRAHSLSDGIALVGIRNLISAKPTPSVLTIDGGTKKVAIKNLAANLKTLIDLLITTLTSATVQGPGVYPFTATTITALNNVKTQFDLLFDEGIS